MAQAHRAIVRRLQVLGLGARACACSQVPFSEASGKIELRVLARTRLEKLRTAHKSVPVKRDIDETNGIRRVCKHWQRLNLIKTTGGGLHGDHDVPRVGDRLCQYLIRGFIFSRSAAFLAQKSIEPDDAGAAHAGAIDQARVPIPRPFLQTHVGRFDRSFVDFDDRDWLVEAAPAQVRTSRIAQLKEKIERSIL